MANYKNARICDNNRLEDATTVAPEVVGYEFSNALDLKNRNKLYKPGAKVFTFDIDLNSFQKNVSCFAIIGGSDDYLKLSNEAKITIKANSIKLFDGGEPLSIEVPVNELNIFANFSDEGHPNGYNYRFWQIDIDDSRNPDDIEIAYIYLGDNTIIHRNIATGFTYNIADNSQVSRSDSGKVFARKRPEQTRLSGTSIQFLSYEDKENLQRTVRKIGRHTPFLFVLDPTEAMENNDNSIRPMYFDRTPSFRQQIRNIYSTTFGMSEVM